MAKSEETLNLMDSFAEFKEQKNIDRSTLVSVLEESIRNVIIKMFGSDENYNVIINPDKGNFEIWRTRTVVKDEDLQDKDKEISLSEVKALGEDFELGEEYSDKVDFLKFGRRAILNLRQILASKILELQKDALYAKYSEKVGQIITGEVYQTWKKEVLLLELFPLVAKGYLTGVKKKAYEAKMAAEAATAPKSEAAPKVEETKPKAAITGNTVNAPLPGRVVEVLVKVGDEIKVGQDVVILEAMKMENSISSDYKGKVKQILVSAGDSVQTNDALIEIE